MKLTAIVLAMLASLPPYYTDVDEVGREARMQTIAEAISQATERASCTGVYEGDECKPIWPNDPVELAALLVTKGWWESRFASNVHAGKCKPDECDPSIWRGVVVHRARSPWQFQKTAFSYRLWDDVLGTDLESTRNAAWVAATILSRGYDACQSAYGALAWYGVQRCTWKGARNRHFTYTKLMALPH